MESMTSPFREFSVWSASPSMSLASTAATAAASASGPEPPPGQGRGRVQDLFEEAMLVDRHGNILKPSHVLPDRTVVLYFNRRVERCRLFSKLLQDFHDLVQARDPSLLVISVSLDKTANIQAKAWGSRYMHDAWLSLAWGTDNAVGKQLARRFSVTSSLSVVMLGPDGKPLVADAQHQIMAILTEDKQNLEELGRDVQAKWFEWRRLASALGAADGGYQLGDFFAIAKGMLCGCGPGGGGPAANTVMQQPPWLDLLEQPAVSCNASEAATESLATRSDTAADPTTPPRSDTVPA